MFQFVLYFVYRWTITKRHGHNFVFPDNHSEHQFKGRINYTLVMYDFYLFMKTSFNTYAGNGLVSDGTKPLTQW